MSYFPQPVPAHIDSTDELRQWLEEELRRLARAYQEDELAQGERAALIEQDVDEIETRLTDSDDLVSFSAGPIALTTAVALTIASGSIPAGTWDIYGSGLFTTSGSTSTSEFQLTIDTTANVVNSAVPDSWWERVPAILDWNKTVYCGPKRVVLGSPTTYRANARSIFSGGACNVSAGFQARRVIV